MENWNISENRGGCGSVFGNCVNRSIFIRFRNGWHQIVQKSNPLTEKYPKKILSPHIRGGEPVNFHINNFLGVSWKLWGSHPPLYIYIYIFNIFSIRGLLFWTIWSLPFWNLIKIERLTQFPKKSPNPPKLVENWNISENRGGADFFFEIVSIAQFLSDFKTNGTKLFRRAIPL